MPSCGTLPLVLAGQIFFCMGLTLRSLVDSIKLPTVEARICAVQPLQ